MKLKDYFEKKSWENNLDKKLPEEIIKKLNKISDIKILSTCAGHPKNAELIFSIKKFKGKTFNEIKCFYDNIVKKLKENLKSSEIKWICLVDNNDFFYDSSNGFNKKLIKLHTDIEPLKNEIPSKIFIKIVNPNGTNDDWWESLFNIISKI